ncbi:hypothetical protein KXD93_18470 [Mucilaginibacter sp. BJC16-A38]|uniref:hypothetical protein n=1 Tax=Mucilaginibacter phenanthrenivorans TaxID=1234842 RepID=UPI002157D860|nr:hypothetical protein [Mucilaginibacter phenanthrenivorans]MCR8559649.1 hypothetical protein [Mucilaginibacter phenanthrenivorans]
MYKLLLCFLLVTIGTETFAQNKKVAVVTFYADKRIDLSDFGLNMTADLLKLDEDPNFNLTPMVDDFHGRFFNDYAKSFPFQLVPEAEITGTDAYKTYAPDDRPTMVKDVMFTPAIGYKVIEYNWGKKNEQNLLKMFPQYDGIMFVSINFSLQKGFAIGGTGTVKVRATANIVLLSKDDKKVFSINESSTSKKTTIAIGGIPVLKPEKILPMCESALNELMEDLQKRIPKIIKKTEAKL